MTPPRVEPLDAPDAWRWRLLAGILLVAGIAHFVVPNSFASIVPHALPGSGRFWTFVSGIVELALAAGVIVARTRRASATVAAIFFVCVFPANVQMAVDWADRAGWQFAIALVRLPIQIPLIWLAWTVRTHTANRDATAQV